MPPQIAILGWGSLLWEGGSGFDQWHDNWRGDGPTLSLEFSRVSSSRLGALTLVIDPQHGSVATVAWCLSKRKSPEDAVACAYCFEKDMLGYKRMPFEIARRAIDLLLRYSRHETDLHVAHFGGEPTLNFNAIKAVTEYAEPLAAEVGKKINFNMTSNGVLIGEEIAEYCGRHNIRVLLSIDGSKATHDR